MANDEDLRKAKSNIVASVVALTLLAKVSRDVDLSYVTRLVEQVKEALDEMERHVEQARSEGYDAGYADAKKETP